MSNAKHTPGPWRINTDSNLSNMVCDADGNTVASFQSRWWSGQKFTEKEAETLANGRLIAAAPELLAALAEYLVLGAGKCTIGKPTADKALAAVRKATGGN